MSGRSSGGDSGKGSKPFANRNLNDQHKPQNQNPGGGRSSGYVSLVANRKPVTKPLVAAPLGPVNTPSLKRENNGKDMFVNLVPQGSASVWKGSEEGKHASTESVATSSGGGGGGLSAMTWNTASSTGPESAPEESSNPADDIPGVIPVPAALPKALMGKRTTNWADMDSDEDDEPAQAMEESDQAALLSTPLPTAPAASKPQAAGGSAPGHHQPAQSGHGGREFNRDRDRESHFMARGGERDHQYGRERGNSFGNRDREGFGGYRDRDRDRDRDSGYNRYDNRDRDYNRDGYGRDRDRDREYGYGRPDYRDRDPRDRDGYHRDRDSGFGRYDHRDRDSGFGRYDHRDRDSGFGRYDNRDRDGYRDRDMNGGRFDNSFGRGDRYGGRDGVRDRDHRDNAVLDNRGNVIPSHLVSSGSGHSDPSGGPTPPSAELTEEQKQVEATRREYELVQRNKRIQEREQARLEEQAQEAQRIAAEERARAQELERRLEEMQAQQALERERAAKMNAGPADADRWKRAPPSRPSQEPETTSSRKNTTVPVDTNKSYASLFPSDKGASSVRESGEKDSGSARNEIDTESWSRGNVQDLPGHKPRMLYDAKTNKLVDSSVAAGPARSPGHPGGGPLREDSGRHGGRKSKEYESSKQSNKYVAAQDAKQEERKAARQKLRELLGTPRTSGVLYMYSSEDRDIKSIVSVGAQSEVDSASSASPGPGRRSKKAVSESPKKTGCAPAAQVASSSGSTLGLELLSQAETEYAKVAEENDSLLSAISKLGLGYGGSTGANANGNQEWPLGGVGDQMPSTENSESGAEWKLPAFINEDETSNEPVQSNRSLASGFSALLQGQSDEKQDAEHGSGEMTSAPEVVADGGAHTPWGSDRGGRRSSARGRGGRASAESKKQETVTGDGPEQAPGQEISERGGKSRGGRGGRGGRSENRGRGGRGKGDEKANWRSKGARGADSRDGPPAMAPDHVS